MRGSNLRNQGSVLETVTVTLGEEKVGGVLRKGK